MSRAPLLLRLGVSGLLLGLLISRLQWRELESVFAGAQLGLLAVVLAGSPLLIGLLTWRLQLLLRLQGIALPFGALLRMTWAGQFFNAFLPGSTGGDVFKLYHIGRLAPEAHAAGAAAVMLDRLLALGALLLLAGLAFAVEPAPLRQLLGQGVTVGGILPWLVLGGLALAAGVFLFRRRLTRAGGRLARLLAAVGRVLAAARQGFRWNRLTVGAVLLALATHLGNFLGVYLLAHALHIGISFPQTVLMMPVVLLVIMLPITINGHGLREMVMIGYFQLLHLGGPAGSAVAPAQMAVALSLAFVANDLGCSLPGGLWHLLAPMPPKTVTPPAAASC